MRGGKLDLILKSHQIQRRTQPKAVLNGTNMNEVRMLVYLLSKLENSLLQIDSLKRKQEQESLTSIALQEWFRLLSAIYLFNKTQKSSRKVSLDLRRVYFKIKAGSWKLWVD